MIRSRQKPVSNRFDTEVQVRAYRFKGAAPLVTLDDPRSGTESARGAFVRLQVPEGLSEAEIDSWRQRVAKVAKAVKVIPYTKEADVPLDAQRVENDEKVGTIREEAIALAKTMSTADVLVPFVTKILDEVGA